MTDDDEWIYFAECQCSNCVRKSDETVGRAVNAASYIPWFLAFSVLMLSVILLATA